jgi:PTH1 family peptidyl-tRNA hydrolase
MKLFVGLGNPGGEYVGTRHNMGFVSIDKFTNMAAGIFDKDGFKGIYGLIKNPDFSEPIIVLKPQTFMNLSGTSVRTAADYFKIPSEDIVIVYDDMALPIGTIRLRENGTSGGHKGMQSVIDQFGTDSIKRIRIGIGEPPHKDAIDYVLGKPKGDDLALVDESTDNAAKALRDIEIKGFAYAMSTYNGSHQKE